MARPRKGSSDKKPKESKNDSKDSRFIMNIPKAGKMLESLLEEKPNTSPRIETFQQLSEDTFKIPSNYEGPDLQEEIEDEDIQVGKALSLSIETYNQQTGKREDQYQDENELTAEMLNASKECQITEKICSSLIEKIYSESAHFPEELKKGISREQLSELIRYVQNFSTPDTTSLRQKKSGENELTGKHILQTIQQCISQGSNNPSEQQILMREKLVQIIKLVNKLAEQQIKLKKMLPSDNLQIQLSKSRFRQEEKNRYNIYYKLKQLLFQSKTTKKILKKRYAETDMVYVKLVEIDKQEWPQMSDYDQKMLEIRHPTTSNKVLKHNMKQSRKTCRRRGRIQAKQKYLMQQQGETDGQLPLLREGSVRLNPLVKRVHFDKSDAINLKHSKSYLLKALTEDQLLDYQFQELKKPKFPQYRRQVVQQVRRDFKNKYIHQDVVPDYLKCMFPQKTPQEAEVFSDGSEDDSALSGQTEFYRQVIMAGIESYKAMQEQLNNGQSNQQQDDLSEYSIGDISSDDYDYGQLSTPTPDLE